jgi:hypothetical protein
MGSQESICRDDACIVRSKLGRHSRSAWFPPDWADAAFAATLVVNAVRVFFVPARQLTGYLQNGFDNCTEYGLVLAYISAHRFVSACKLACSTEPFGSVELVSCEGY